jgi:hypothetical protein
MGSTLSIQFALLRPELLDMPRDQSLMTCTLPSDASPPRKGGDINHIDINHLKVSPGRRGHDPRVGED